MKGILKPPPRLTFDEIDERWTTEQILAVFGIGINSANKALCPFHADRNPSLHVHKDFAYCFACKRSWNNYALAKELLEKTTGQPAYKSTVFDWFLTTDFPAASPRSYNQNTYQGPVDREIVTYWHIQLTDEHYQKLCEDRLLTRETIDKYLLGWRPDWEAFVIPFLRPTGEVDIVQFRMTRPTAKSKYMGMAGHNRGSVMNWDLLDTPQPYLIVLFGAFDSILARQDGLLAVGFNGSLPFRKNEKTRVKELFTKQTKVYVVPDNTVAEYDAAYQFAEWTGAEVCFFPRDLPEDTDYIDFRKLGHTPDDFRKLVLGMEVPDDILIEDILAYTRSGDPYNLLPVYLAWNARGRVVQDIALALAEKIDDEKCHAKLLTVITLDQLFSALESLQHMFYYRRGGW